MTNYARMYRWGHRPWERYVDAASGSIAAMLDRESADRPRPPGRALDLGCGRGLYTRELALRDWETVGVDNVPAAIEAANARDTGGAVHAVADVTDLGAAGLGTFDLFLDIGCFQGLDARQRAAEGAGVTELSRPGATLLMLQFGPTRLRRFIGGVSQEEVLDAFPGWELVSAEPAETTGLGFPMNRTAPVWYRLRVS